MGDGISHFLVVGVVLTVVIVLSAAAGYGVAWLVDYFFGPKYQSDDHYWITGAYVPLDIDEDDPDFDWVSFAYGPWPSQKAADAVADDFGLMMVALGTDVAGGYEVDTTDRITYSQACKHFEETIQSPYFEKLLPETHAAHLALMERYSL